MPDVLFVSVRIPLLFSHRSRVQQSSVMAQEIVGLTTHNTAMELEIYERKESMMASCFRSNNSNSIPTQVGSWPKAGQRGL